jgi:hypothetical protein
VPDQADRVTFRGRPVGEGVSHSLESKDSAIDRDFPVPWAGVVEHDDVAFLVSARSNAPPAGPENVDIEGPEKFRRRRESPA